jgi:hypothetical protein
MTRKDSAILTSMGSFDGTGPVWAKKKAVGDQPAAKGYTESPGRSGTHGSGGQTAKPARQLNIRNR